MQIQIQPIGVDQSAIVQKIFEASPTYFRKTANSEVQPHFAWKEMTEGPSPEKQTSTYQKVFCLVRVDAETIGVVDLHKDHPHVGLCYIGLLLIEESRQGLGLGKVAYSQIEHFIKTDLGCSTVVLGISQDNDVEGFWYKMGFRRNGRGYTYSSEGHESQVFEMEKGIR